MTKRLLSVPAILIIAVTVAGGLSLLECDRWQGKYSQAEFQLTITRGDGSPVEGVGLQVEDQLGKKSFWFPVTDYSPNSIPRSDSKGVLTFHHVTRAAELGGDCRRLFFVIPLGGCSSPSYACILFYDGKEVGRVDYKTLDKLASSQSDLSSDKVKRQWTWHQNTPETIKNWSKESEEAFDFFVVRYPIRITAK